MILTSSKRLAYQFLIKKVPRFAAVSSRKNSNFSEVLNEPVPARKSYRDYQTLNVYQRDALAASLDDSKPMVTVLGSSGSGKTLLVVEMAHSMRTKNQRVLIICGSREILYSTVCRYLRRTKCSGHFVHLQPFDEKAAFRVVPDIRRQLYAFHPAVREALAKRSLVELVSRQKAKRHNTDLTSEMAKVLQSPTARDQTRVVFATPDDVFALLGHLSPLNGPSSSSPSPPTLFDAVVLEDVAALEKADDWRAFLPLAPLFRVFSDPHHSIALPPLSTDCEETPFQCSIVQQIAPNENDETSPVFVLRSQYRTNMNTQIWSGRAFYAPLGNEIDLARPVAYTKVEMRLNHLMDQLVLDERSVFTDTLTLVDTGALEGHWTQQMFQPSKMGASLVNWGEAFLSAVHINSLLCYGIWPYQIACFTQSSAHGEAVRRILFTLNKSLVSADAAHMGYVEFGPVEQYLGRTFEAIVKSFVSDAAFAASFRSQRALHYLSAELIAANRQIFMIGPLNRFRQLRKKEAYEFVSLFQLRGTILSPSDLFKLHKGQFEEIVKEAKAFHGSAAAKNKIGQLKRDENKRNERRQQKTFEEEANDQNRRTIHHRHQSA